VEATLRALRRVPADRVVAQTEYGLLAGSLLLAERGEPGPSPRAAWLTVNKWLGRRALGAAGVPVPRFALAASAAEVRGAGLGYPLVLKPVASTLGRLVRRVDRDGDLDAAVAALRARLGDAPDIRRATDFARLAGLELGCDPTRQFLAESFAEGIPCETDGLLFGEDPDLFGVLEQVVSEDPGFPIEAYLLPASDPGARAETTRAALRALGLADTGFSIEFRGEALIEVNGRLGEDAGFPDLFAAALGEAPILRWLRGHAGPPPGPGGHALAYRNHARGGTVRALCGPSGVRLLAAPGDRLAPPGDPAFAPHLAWALASDPSGARAAFATARRALDGVTVEWA
jgi:hypothetical protein